MNDETTLSFIKQTLRAHLPDPSYRLFLFGSRATNTARKFSDVDVGIEGPKPVSSTILMNVQETLEESDVPFKVDVVDFFHTSDRFRALAKKYAQPL